MSQTLRVLTYHRIARPAVRSTYDPSLISATPAEFERQMADVAARYRAVSAKEVAAAVRAGSALPRRAVLITFDDATRDFAEAAWPVLRRHGLPAVLFVPTAYPDRPDRCFWWDRVYRAIVSTRLSHVDVSGLGVLALDSPGNRHAALGAVRQRVKQLPHRAAMRLVDDVCRQLGEPAHVAADVLTWGELRRLSAEGVELAPHTHTHPALTRLTLEEARDEICRSRDELQRQVGRVAPVFAYPFGDHDARVVEILREEGFVLGLTCEPGHNRLGAATALTLRRTNVTRRTTPLLFRLRLTVAGSYADRVRHVRLRHPAGTAPAAGMKVAYIMSRFPKLSETFVLNEMIALEHLGADVQVYPLLRARQAVAHPDAARWVRRAHFSPFLSLPILAANAHFLRRQPRVYARVLAEVLAETWGSRNFFLGAIGIFPKAVRFAYDMRRQGVTHVHAHFATHPAVAALIVHRLTGIPFSFTAHGSDLHVDRRMLDAKVAAAAFVVTVSDFNKNVITQTCGAGTAGKVQVIHCGVDPGAFAPAGERPRGAAFQIVCVASLEEVKGHRFLVEACELLQARGLDFECHLVGDGPMRRDIEARVARSGLGKRVHLHGGKPRPDVIRMLSAADVAVLASHPTPEGKREGIPVALMEAMASELPVVASAISGIPELVQHGVTGLLVPSGQPKAIAAAIEALAGDPELRRCLGQAARREVLRGFDLHVNARRLLALMARADPLALAS